MKTLLFAAFLALSLGVNIPLYRPDLVRNMKMEWERSPAIKEEIVSLVNSKKIGWTASTEQNWLTTATIADAKKLMGALRKKNPDGTDPFVPMKTFDLSNLQAVPSQFDARTNWPNCPTIQQIRDQSACGSCWAFGAVESMSDRLCTYNVSQNKPLSTEDMTACCFSCGFGCGGGYPGAAWDYWHKTGVVTDACSPYTLPSCDHHVPGSKNPCPSNEYPTPPCVKKCVTTNNTWTPSLTFGATSYAISQGESAIMAEIYAHGPVETAFSVYEDFLTYKSGVYTHTTGSYLGGHAVKFLGWGVENGQKYWLVANSWNPTWGDKGFFKILRGVNECGIEDTVWAGAPKAK